MGCVVWIEAGRVGDAREDGGFGGGQLCGGFAEVELRGGFGAEGVASEVRGVEVPLEDLGAPELGGDLRGKDAFTQGALQPRFFVEEQQVENETLCEGGVQFGVAETRERVARVTPKLRIGLGDDRVGQGPGQVLRIGIAERNVAAR